MDTTNTIIIIVVLLVIGIGASVFIQMRENAKAEIRQKLAKLLYRAREGQDLLDKFNDMPIGTDARKIILQYILLNLKRAKQVSPNDSSLLRHITEVQTKLSNLSEPVSSPPSFQDPNEGVLYMGKAKSLMRYVHKIGRIPNIDVTAARNALKYLKQLYLHLQTKTYTAIAYKKIGEKAYNQAMVAVNNASQLLVNQNIGSNDTQLQLKELEDLKQEIKRLSQNPESDQQQEGVEEEQDETKDLGDTDDLFQPKKKW